MAQPTVTNNPITSNEASRPSPVLSATISGTKRKRPSDKKVYAVKEGRVPGIYNSWDECLMQVRGHKGALFKAFSSSHEAQAFVDGKLLPSASTSRQNEKQKFYAVQKGKVPGVYNDWLSAQTQIENVRYPKYKRFSTPAEAEAFVAEGKQSHQRAPQVDLSAEEQRTAAMIERSAPGLALDGLHTPKMRDGKLHPPGRGPMPKGTDDGFDPNIRLSEDGTIVRKTEEEKLKVKLVPKHQDPPGMLRIYTDGSSLRNGQAGARAGVGVFFGPQDPKNVSEALKGTRQTNQRAELTAILRALDIAPRHRDVTIYTDSKYSINCVTNWYKNWQRNGWLNAKGKSVENKDLITDIREKIEERDFLKRGTYFIWVKGHAADEGNIAADKLAVAGSVIGREIDGEARVAEDVEKVEAATERIGDRNCSGEEDSQIAEAYKAMAEAMQSELKDESEE